MYKKDLVLNNLQGLMRRKTKPNQTIGSEIEIHVTLSTAPYLLIYN